MPEAPVHEYRDAGGAEEDVGTPPYPWNRAAIDAVAEAESMERGADSNFRCGVTPLGRLHPASGLG